MLQWQNDLWSIYLLYFLIGAAGFACLFTPLLALSGLWFNQRKGLAIGIVTAGGAIGQGIVPYLTQLMTTEFGWRDAAFYLGAGYSVLLFPLLFLLRPAPSVAQPLGQAEQPNSNLWGVPHAITIPWLSLAGFFCCVCMAVPLVHLVPLGIDLGCSPRTAAGLLLSLMVSGVFGRLFFGWLADRTGGLPAYFLASLAQTSVVFWFTQTRDIATLYQLSVLFGFGFAGVMTCLLICAREAAPLRMSGLAMAIVSLAGWIGMGLGSYQAGLFYDITASYLLSYGNAAIAGILNLLVVAALIWYRRRATGWSRRTAATSSPGPKFAMSLRIDQPVDALRRGHREPHRHHLAGRRRQPVFRRLAMQMRAIGVRHDQAGCSGKISHGRSRVKAKNSRSQCARYSCHFWSARKSSTDDLISTIQISPRSFSATRSARRPDGSGNSLTQENPSERSSRAVPRAIASAVSDWRRSGGGTRLTWRAGDSM